MKKTIVEIAEDLIQHDVCIYNGYLFEYAGQTYAMLNDSTSEDSVQEYAIVLLERTEGNIYFGKQVESLTTHWTRKCLQTDVLATSAEVADDSGDCAEYRESGEVKPTSGGGLRWRVYVSAEVGTWCVSARIR